MPQRGVTYGQNSQGLSGGIQACAVYCERRHSRPTLSTCRICNIFTVHLFFIRFFLHPDLCSTRPLLRHDGCCSINLGSASCKGWIPPGGSCHTGACLQQGSRPAPHSSSLTPCIPSQAFTAFMLLVPAGMSADVYRKLSALLSGKGRALLQGGGDPMGDILKKLADGINGGVVSTLAAAAHTRLVNGSGLIPFAKQQQQQHCLHVDTAADRAGCSCLHTDQSHTCGQPSCPRLPSEAHRHVCNPQHLTMCSPWQVC